MMGWGVGGGMLTFLLLRTLYLASLLRYLVLLLRYMLLRCRHLWCCCCVICCYRDVWWGKLTHTFSVCLYKNILLIVYEHMFSCLCHSVCCRFATQGPGNSSESAVLSFRIWSHSFQIIVSEAAVIFYKSAVIFSKSRGDQVCPIILPIKKRVPSHFSPSFSISRHGFQSFSLLNQLFPYHFPIFSLFKHPKKNMDFPRDFPMDLPGTPATPPWRVSKRWTWAVPTPSPAAKWWKMRCLDWKRMGKTKRKSMVLGQAKWQNDGKIMGCKSWM